MIEQFLNNMPDYVCAFDDVGLKQTVPLDQNKFMFMIIIMIGMSLVSITPYANWPPLSKTIERLHTVQFFVFL